ncbi:MAG: allophanate hydrolase subunit 1 [Corynebacterium sp.]|nr:allophanate hydrolase subunit 1 [Corynebacterium sp.]
MDVKPCGDAAVLIDIHPQDAELAGISTLAAVMNVHQQIQDLNIAGVIDIVPAAATVLITLDTALCTPKEAGNLFRDIEITGGITHAGREVIIPVTYDGADLEVVAEATGLSVREVVEKHTTTPWLAAFGGFAPGFMYLVPQQPLWNIPRRSQPRAQIPAGAVALAGEFSGVYPQVSPGGWQLLGTTTIPMWDTQRPQPSYILPGDTVIFQEHHA